MLVSTQDETNFTPVNDVNSAFLHNQMRMNSGTSTDGLGHAGAQIGFTADDTITYSLPQTTQNWGSGGTGGQIGVSWIIENTDTNAATKMVVQHLDPTERVAADTSEGARQ